MVKTLHQNTDGITNNNKHLKPEDKNKVKGCVTRKKGLWHRIKKKNFWVLLRTMGLNLTELENALDFDRNNRGLWPAKNLDGKKGRGATRKHGLWIKARGEFQWQSWDLKAKTNGRRTKQDWLYKRAGFWPAKIGKTSRRRVESHWCLIHLAEL